MRKDVNSLSAVAARGACKLPFPLVAQLLRVQITSEEDPFFLHSLEVSEEDFQTLKVEQSLLVDFSTFPSKLIELLQEGIRCRGEEPPR